MQTKALIMGTRGSPLAKAQGFLAAGLLPHMEFTHQFFTTSGDQLLDKPLVEFGGKGLFTRELDDALLRGEIDCAVHSAKDLPAQLPAGIVMAAVLPREDARDVFIGNNGMKFTDLPHGAHIGTASLRRTAQVQRLRPDITTGLLRGNVGTRLRKVAEGEFDGTLLAAAGLHRLTLMQSEYEYLPFDSFMPAGGQGFLAITARADDTATLALLAPLNHAPSAAILGCERSFLHALGASCRMALAAHASISSDTILFTARFYASDPAQDATISHSGPLTTSATVGAYAAKVLIDQSEALRVYLAQ